MKPYEEIGNERVRVAVAPHGAALGRYEVRLPDGRWRNIVLTRPDPTDDSFFGATVGRFANRIGGARFTLDGRVCDVTPNEGPNQLHGGPGGFYARTWDVVETAADRVVLALTSPDGDQGFPGTMRVTATFSLVDGGAQVCYVATTDTPTVVNITAHPYFNLNGAGVGRVDEHRLRMPAGRFTVTDDANIPTGELRDVTGLGLDFREPRLIGEARTALVGDGLTRDGGFDYNLVVDGDGLREHVRLVGPDGLTLVVRSDAPAVQIYDGGSLDGSLVGPDGLAYERFGGLAIEPQNYPDAPNHAGFPSAVLRPGEEYRRTIQWLVA